MSKLLELTARPLHLPRYIIVLSCFFLVACGDGADLSGLLSSSTGTEEDGSGGLSDSYGLSAIPGLTEVSLSWDEDPAATSYDLYRYQDSNCAFVPDNYTACDNASYRTSSVASAVDTGLSSNSIYYYRVRSVSAEQTGELSSQLEVLTLPSAPSSLAATVTNGRVTLSWQEQSGIDQYQLYRYSNEDCDSVATSIVACDDDESWAILGGDTSQQDNGLDGGETYYYQIASVNASGSSSLSSQLTFTAPPASIDGFGIVSSTDAIGGISLVWNDSAGASYYEIYRDSTSGCEGIPDDLELCPDAVQFTTEESEYVDSSAQEGFSYYYSVRAMNDSGASVLTTQRSASMPLELFAPVLSSISAQDFAIDLEWSAVDKAFSYQVFISTEPNCSSFPNSPEDCPGFVWLLPDTNSNITEATSASFSDLAEGTTYYLSVRAATGDTFSDLSLELNATTAPVAPDSESFQAIGGDGFVDLTWAASAGADTYSLYWHNDPSCLDSVASTDDIIANCSDYSIIADIVGESHIHSDLATSTNYYYYLLAHNAAGVSAITEMVSALTAPAAVQDLAAASDTSAITISWSSDQDNLERFELYRYQDSGCDSAGEFACSQQSSWPDIDAGASSYTDTTAAIGEIYYYQLAAVNTTAKTLSSEVVSALQLSATDQIGVVASEGLLTVSWSAVIGAEHYVLYRYSGDCPLLPDTTGSCNNYQALELDGNLTTYADSAVLAGEFYSYQVAARISGAEDSELSAIVTSSPLIASPELALTPVGGGVRIEFALISGAESYNIYRYYDAGCLINEDSVSASCLEYELLQFSADSSDLINPDNTTSALYDDLGLVGGDTYYYRASAVNAIDNSELSPEVSSFANLAQPVMVGGITGYGNSSVEWGAVLGAETYTIYQYVADGSACYPQSTTATALCIAGFVERTITADINNSSAGHTYTQDYADLDGALDYGYVVLASNALVPDSALSEPLLLHIGLPAPEGLVAAPGASAVALAWNSVTNSVGYSVLRSSEPSCLGLDSANESCLDYALLPAGLELSLTDTGIEGGTTYYYRVTALEDSSTTGAYSDEVNATPTLSTPENVQALPGSGVVELSWDPVLGAEGYTIYRYTQQPCSFILENGADCGDLYVESNNSAHSHISSSLIGEQIYYFRVAATHTGLSDSGLSEEVSATPEVGIPALTVSVIENNLTVSWEAVAGISGYNLHRSTSESCFLELAPAQYDSNSSLCPDYQFWPGITTTSISESELSLNQSYYYAAQSVVGDIAIDIISNVASGLPLAQPQWLELTGGVDEVTITWDTATTGAETYAIYRSSMANCAEAIADWQQCPQGRIFSGQSSGVFVDQDSLDPGQTYYYRLQALNYSGYAFNPSELNATTAPGVPADINVSFSEIGVSAQWDDDQLGVTQYDLYRYSVAECAFIPDAYQQCGDDSQRWLDTTSPLLDPVEDLKPGTVYYYTLVVSNAAGSNISSEQQIITGSAAPEIGALIGGFGSIEVSWGSVFGADSYNLYRYAKADCSDAEIVELSADCSAYKFTDVSSPFTDPPSAEAELQLASSTYYYYRLTSTNSSATSALSEIGAGLTKPDAPEIILAAGGDKSAYLEYTSANANLNNFIFTRDDVSGCNLDIGTEVCPFMVELDGDLDTNYTDTDLNPGTTYYYHAYAVNNSGRSLASNEVNITTIPNPPLNLAAAAASTTEIIVTWDRQIGADSYILYRYTDPSCSTEQLEANISQCGSELNPAQLIADIADDTATPQYIDYGLNSDAYYYYRIRAQNSGGISEFSEEVFSLTSPSQPSDLVGIGGDAEVNLSWTPVANASYYYLYKYTNEGCSTYADDIASCSDGSQRQISPESIDAPISFYQDTEVSNSTYYYYRIQAINASGSSAISSELEVLTYPADPQSITSSVSSSKISLTWSIENSVTNYDLYRYSDSGCTTFQDTNSTCDDAVLYQITNTGSDIDTQSKTDDDNLQAGTIYYYRLISYNTSGGKISDELAIATAPATPENFTVTPIIGLDPSLELSWSIDPTGVADFTIYRYQPAGCLLDDGDTSACDAGFPITFNGITAQSFTDATGLATGTQYTYRVLATSSYSGQAQSALSDEESAFTYPASPAITGFAAGADSIAISFDANQTGADSYTLHRYSGLSGCVSLLGVVTNCNDYQLYSNQTLSPIIDNDLESGTIYYYRIASNGAAGTGIYSDEYSTITLPAALDNIDLTVSLDGIVASWDADHQGADSFILYRSRTLNCLSLASDGSLCDDYLEVDSLTSGEYNDTGLPYGYEYYYQIRAVNASGLGALSAAFSAYTLPPAPSIDSTVGGINQIEITYSNNTLGVTSYNLYRYSDSGCEHVPGDFYTSCADGQRWSSANAVTNSTETIIDSNLEDGTTYYYRLSAVNSSGEGLASEEYAAITVPGAPSITALIGGSNQIQIEFTDDVETATSYLIHRYSISGCYDSNTTTDLCDANQWQTLSVLSSPAIDFGLDDGTEYYYAVAAVNESGSSLYSVEDSAITIPAESAIFAVTGGDDFDYIAIDFNDSITGADTYHVYGYTGANCIQRLSDYSSKQAACSAVLIESSTSPAFEYDLGYGVTRYYRVASVNDSGSSDLSSQVSGITLPPLADDITFTGDATSITLSWNDAQNGVSSYTAYQYTSSGCANFAATDESSVLSNCSALQTYSDAESPVTFTSLSPGSSYYHLIKSSNATGYRFTEEFDVTTVPNAPPAPTLTGGIDSITINFDTTSVSGAEYYQIYRSTTSACVRNSSAATCSNLVTLPTNTSEPLTASDFPYTDTGLLAGTTYYYHLSAHNDLGASEYSDESVLITTPDAPSDIILTPARNAMVLSWSNNPGVESTRIYRYTNSGCSGVPSAINACTNPGYADLDSTITTYTDPNLDDGTTYYYTLEAVNATGSTLSSEYSDLTHPAATTITSIAGGELNATIFFDDVLSGAVDEYIVHRHSSPEADCLVENSDYSLDSSACLDFETLPTILEPDLTASPYTDINRLSPGLTYHYQIQSVNSSGSSYLSDPESTITIPAAPLASNIEISTSIDDSGASVITITWNNDILGNTNGSTLYRYTISGCEAIYGNNPDASQCSADGDYQVWEQLTDTSTAFTIQDDAGLQPDTYYYYVIQVSNASGSAYSEEVSITTYPSVPADPTLIGGVKEIVVEWDNSVSTATGYILYFNSDSSCPAYDDTSCTDYFSQQFAPSANSFTFDNLADGAPLVDGTTYYVTLVAENESGARASNTVSGITLPTAPVFSAVEISTSNPDHIDLTWTQSGIGIEDYSLVRYEELDCMTADGNYSACDSAKLYVYESDTAIAASETSFTDSNDLQPAIRYYYRLGANNASGTVWSDVGDQVLAPEVITPSVVSGSEYLTISWDIPEGQEISHVKVYSTSQNGCSAVPATDTAQCTDWWASDEIDSASGSTTYTPTDDSKTYYLYLHVFNASGDALSSSVSGVLLAAAPEFQTITGGDTSIYIQWERFDNASYTLYFYDQSCPDPENNPSACGNLEIHSPLYENDIDIASINSTALAIGTEYFFRVSVTNSAGTSALSDEHSAYTIASVPQNVVLTPGANQISISWTASQGATGDYNIYRTANSCSSASSSAQLLVDCSATLVASAVTSPHTDSNLLPGTTYYYRVTAVNESGESGPSVEASAQPLLGAPEGLSAESTESGVELQWVTINGATAHEIYRYTSNNCMTTRADMANCTDYQTFTSNASATYTDATIDGGTVYYYRVAAFQGLLGPGELSNQAVVTAELLAPVTNYAIAGYGSVTLDWQSVDGADSYKIYRATSSSCLSGANLSCAEATLTTSSTTYTDTGLDGLQTYYYRIAAASSDPNVNDSPLSDELSATTELPAPTGLAASSSELRIDLSWDAVTSSALNSSDISYTVYRYTNTDSSCTAPHQSGSDLLCTELQSFTVSTNSYTDTSFDTIGTNYRYRVQSLHDDGSTSSAGDISAEVIAQPILATPEGLSLERGSTSLTLSWSAVDYADDYLVHIHNDSGCASTTSAIASCSGYSSSTTSGATTYAFANLDPTITYYLTAQATRSGADSPSGYGAVQSAIPYLAEITGFQAYASDALEITAEWDALPNATSYTVYFHQDPNCTYSGYSDPSEQSVSCVGVSTFTISDTTKVFTESANDITEGETYYFQVRASSSSPANVSAYTDRLQVRAFANAGITSILGADQEINLTFDDAGGSYNLEVYRYTDGNCIGQQLSENVNDCAETDDANEWSFLSAASAIPEADKSINDSSGLDEGKRYYYMVWSTPSSGEPGTYSPAYSAMTMPPAPKDLGLYNAGTDGANNTYGTQIVLTFAQPEGEDNFYQLLRHNDADCFANLSDANFDRFDYRELEAVTNSSGESCTGLTALPNADPADFPAISATESHTDTGLTPSTTYYYLYRSVNYSGSKGVDSATSEDGGTLSGTSIISNQVHWSTIPRASADGDLSIDDVNDTSISYSFAEIPTATTYTVHRYLSTTCDPAIDTSTCTQYEAFTYDVAEIGTTFADTDLDPGTQYTYILQAHNSAGSSDLAYSHSVNKYTLSGDPTITAIIASIDGGADKLTISWNDDVGVQYRSVYGSTDQGCLSGVVAAGFIDSKNNITGCDNYIYRELIVLDNDLPISAHADDTSLLSGTTYYFTITNHNDSGVSDNFAAIESNITIPAAVNDLSLEPDYREIAVTWVPTLGSASNVLYRYTERNCDPIDDLADISLCGADTAAYTFVAEDSENSYFGFEPDSTQSFTFTDTNLSTGLLDAQDYYYAVQALNVSGYRLTEDAFIKSATTAPAIPTGFTSVASDNNITLTWDSMATATQYRMLRSSDADCYTDISGVSAYDITSCNAAAIFTINPSSTNTETYTDTSLSYGTTYYYWIRSYSTSGFSPSTAAEANTTAPPRATQVALSATRGGTNQTNIEINWDEVSAATSYALYRSTVADCIDPENDGNLAADANTCAGYNRSEISALTSTYSNRPNETTYYYYVAGINAAGEGRLSPVNSIRTAANAPQITSIDNLGSATTMEVNWSATSTTYDSAYDLYLYSGTSTCDPSTSDCTNEKHANINATGAAAYSFTFTNLNSGTQYHAKITATTEYTQADNTTTTLTSDISNSSSEYTLPYHPTITSHTIDQNNNITLTLSFNSGTEAITYTIRRSTDSSCDRDKLLTASSNTCDGFYAQNSSTTTTTDTVAKDNSTYYYYYAWSENPGGVSAEYSSSSSSTAAYSVLTTPTSVLISLFNDDYTLSTYDKMYVSFNTDDDIPANDTWKLVYYPSAVNNPTQETHTVSALTSASGNYKYVYQASLSLDPQYYLQPHTVDLIASNDNNGSFTVDLSSAQVDKLPPVQINPVVLDDDPESYTKQIKLAIPLSSIDSIVQDYGLDLDEVRFYITKNPNCFPYPGDDVESTTCNESVYYNSIKNMTVSDKLYVDYLTSVKDGNYDSTESAHIISHDLSALVPDQGTYTYYYYAAIAEYEINVDHNGLASTRETADYSGADRIIGRGTSFTISASANSSNSVQLPAPTLVPSPPLLSQQLAATSSDHNSWDLSLLWSALSGVSAYDIYEYSDSDCAHLSTDPSLCANFSLYSSNIPEFTRAFSAADSGNYFYYRLQAHDSAGNSSALGAQIAAYPPQPLNDSGLASCIESELISGSQDCSVGRDSQLQPSAKVGSGAAGFDFNASIDASGALCVHDNVTGLSWSSWRPAAALAGAESNITTSSFAELATIAAEACGHSDWRLPSLHELLSIADYNQSAARIDTSVFTEFNLSSPTYWSASGHVLDFSSGELSFESNASARHSVFLARGERSWGSEFGAERFQLIEQLDDNNLSLYLVYDNQTQLHYAPCLAGQSYDPITHSCLGVATALDYIDSLNAYDANSTWRQPNIKELVAILDPSNNLQPNPQFFPAYPSASSIFTLTPRESGADYITGRLFNPATQSTQPAIFELLNSHLIYRN